MIIARDLYSTAGIILLRAGNPLKASYIDTLKKQGYRGCYIDDDISKDIKIKDAISVPARNEAAIMVYEVFSKANFDKNTIQNQLLESIEDVLEDIVEQIMSNRDAVISVMSLKSFDDYTYKHCVDVGVLSILIGKEMGMLRSQLVELGKAAFFHDIGKKFISQSLLFKPDKLTPKEIEDVRRHPQLGHDFLKDNLNMSQRICDVALYHHEHYDGNGYPNGISGTDIPLFARIVAVADSYDAITSVRPYKDAVIASEAYEHIMASSSSQFDPAIVNCFCKKIAPFPVGVTVKLSDGRIAIVKENNPNLMTRPIVKLIKPDVTLPANVLDLALPEYLNITIAGILQ